MRPSRVLLLVLSIAVFGSAGVRCNAAERPGAKEQAEVDSANTVLDGVYRDLMSKADLRSSAGCEKRSAPGLSGETLKPIISRVTAEQSEAVACAWTTRWLS